LARKAEPLKSSFCFGQVNLKQRITQDNHKSNKQTIFQMQHISTNTV